MNNANFGIHAASQDIFEISSTAKHDVGERLQLGDRVFRYGKAGAVALGKALMTQAPAVVTNHKEQVQTAYGWTAGQTVVNVLVGATAVTLDQYKDGYAVINKGTGLNQAYKIKSNTAAVLSGVTILPLYDAVIIAVAATAEITLVANPYVDTIVAVQTTLTAQAVGVPLVAVTAAYYYWSQVAGPCPMTVDTGDTLVTGNDCGTPATNAVAGTVGVSSAVLPIYGRVMQFIGTADETALIFLTLEK